MHCHIFIHHLTIQWRTVQIHQCMGNKWQFSLRVSAFSGLASVEELDLGQNRIQTIDEDTFLGLDHLRVLYLDDNDLQEVPSPALRPLPHLAELNLGLNNIKEIFPLDYICIEIPNYNIFKWVLINQSLNPRNPSVII